MPRPCRPRRSAKNVCCKSDLLRELRGGNTGCPFRRRFHVDPKTRHGDPDKSGFAPAMILSGLLNDKPAVRPMIHCGDISHSPRESASRLLESEPARMYHDSPGSNAL